MTLGNHKHVAWKPVVKYEYVEGNGPVSGKRYYCVNIYDENNTMIPDMCRMFDQVSLRARYVHLLKNKFRVLKGCQA